MTTEQLGQLSAWMKRFIRVSRKISRGEKKRHRKMAHAIELCRRASRDMLATASGE